MSKRLGKGVSLVVFVRLSSHDKSMSLVLHLLHINCAIMESVATEYKDKHSRDRYIPILINNIALIMDMGCIPMFEVMRGVIVELYCEDTC